MATMERPWYAFVSPAGVGLRIGQGDGAVCARIPVVARVEAGGGVRRVRVVSLEQENEKGIGVGEDDDLEVPITPEETPMTPTDWLRMNEGRGPAESFVALSSGSNLANAASGSGNAGLYVGASIFNSREQSSWLYSPPPPYCAVTGSVEEAMKGLDRRVFYLGPVTRNKVVRALEMATTAVDGHSHLRNVLEENVNVAAIVADLQMDCDTVCAAVLRGLIGCDGCSSDDVARDVGPDVLRILDFHASVAESVNLCNEPGFTEISFGNLRELILVGAMDEHRAISLELASAVVATRALDALKDEDARIVMARRAMHLYAPLANQLGIYFIQSELEELAFMYLYPDSFRQIRSQVGEHMRECESTLAESKELLERVLSQTPSVRSKVRTVTIKGRVKGHYSVYRKMRRSGKKLYEIYDLLALRVVIQPRRVDDVSEKEACYAVSDAIKAHYETFESRAKDYLSEPKRNGYRSLHLTVCPPEGGTTPLEIQVRTEKMHHVAEFGAAAHWIYKENSNERLIPSNSGSDDGSENSSSSSSPSPPVFPPSVPSSGMTHTASGSSCSEDFVRDDGSGGNGNGGSGGSGGSGLSMRNRYALRDISNLHRTALRAHSRTMSNDRHSMGSSRSSRTSPASSPDNQRQLYISCLAAAIRTSRVFVKAYGQLYGLTIGSTLYDLARKAGFGALGVIALVNGNVAPLTQRLEMNDIVRFITALPEP